MRLTITFIISLVILNSYSQESKQEFLDVIVEGKEAYMSTTTGEVIFREHAKTDPSAFITDATGTTFYIDTKIYKVKKGDVLATIAKKFKTTIARLKKDNKLKSVDLSIGQALKINSTLAVESLKPTMSSQEGRVVARLRPGENPAMLNVPDGPPNASRTPVATPKEIQSTLKVEDKVEAPAVKEVVQEKTEAVQETIEKRVEDTMDNVEKTVEASEEEVEKELSNTANNIEEEDQEATKFYTVKKGDTLYGIAKANNTSVEAIKTKNKLSSNALSIGQKLKL